MAEPVTVEFDLEPTVLADLLPRKNEKVGQCGFVGIFVLAGALAVSQPDVPVAIFFFGMAALYVVGMVRLPKVREAMALRLAGSTKIQFTDWGMEFTGANVAERVPWPRFKRVNDRPALWVLQTKAPIATFLVPKSAVPAAYREQFTGRLAGWSGAAYKIRKK